MSTLSLPAAILYISSDPSMFGVLKGDKKSQSLEDVTRIDFSLIEDGRLNLENLTHVFESLEQKTIQCILSDDIFFHHIADYKTGNKQTLEEHIKETVGSVFSDQNEPLHIVTVDLAKTAKLQTVQITAMTKRNLNILTEAAQKAKVKLGAILPASFVVKAFVSVDPSLFILETNASYLVSSHYIGVDFAQSVSTDDKDELVSLIKKLKKEHSHVQHAYVCSSKSEELSSVLEDLIPVQTVEEIRKLETDSDTPFFLKILTTGLKDVIDNAFPLPKFTPMIEKLEDEPEEKEEKVEKREAAIAEVLAEESKDDDDDDEKEEKEDKKEVVEEPEEVKEETKKTVKTLSLDTKEEIAVEVPVKSEDAVIASLSPMAAAVIDDDEEPLPEPEPKPEPKTEKVITKTITEEKITESTSDEETTKTSRFSRKKLFRCFLITLAVAAVISIIGTGIVVSQAALKNSNSNLKTPIVENSEGEAPTPTATATPEPVDISALKIKVVNATKIAGKAGGVAANIKKGDVTTVDTGNALGDYETGTFIMFKEEENKVITAQLEELTDLSLQNLEMKSAENAGGKYDIIIVLAE